MDKANESYMHLKLECDISALSGASKTIEAFLDGLKIGSKERYVVALAFEEMASNIIKYGFDKKHPVSPIDVRLAFDGKALALALQLT